MSMKAYVYGLGLLTYYYYLGPAYQPVHLTHDPIQTVSIRSFFLLVYKTIASWSLVMSYGKVVQGV